MDSKVDASIRDIFMALDKDALKTTVDIQIPNTFYQEMLDYFLERGYLNNISEREHFVDFRRISKEHPEISFADEAKLHEVTWLKIERLPIHPNEQKEYDLLSRWQSVLSSLHTWGHRLVFLLQRKGGETGIYLGTSSLEKYCSSEQALEQFREAAVSGMPGIDLKPIIDSRERMRFMSGICENEEIGVITGIPSMKKNTQFGMLQTLDQLAFGVRDMDGNEQDFSMLVIADPVSDSVISKTESNFRRLGSEIHLDVNRSVNESSGSTESKSSEFGIGAVLAGIGSAVGLGAISGMLSGFSKTVTKGISSNRSVITQYLDKFAQYAEKITEMHCERLNKGRNLGFWNTGIYILGKTEKSVNTVMGMLRAVYSGDESYVEPIRAAVLKKNSGAIDIVRRCELIPLVSDKVEVEKICDNWNTLGSVYQYASTPLNTEELSIATSLPRRDVPGLRFVKTAVRFANNPAQVSGDTICLGSVVDTGVVQSNEYRIDKNALVRHAIVAGSTGSGKSTTCKRILTEVLESGVPSMVIEPAKDDYVRWAIEYNKRLDSRSDLSEEEKKKSRFSIFMPGMDSFEGERIRRLKLNPFQPAAVKGATIDILTRCEQVTALINASLPSSDVLPVLIDESLYRFVLEEFGDKILSGDIEQMSDYPKLEGVIATARRVLAARGYDKKVQDDIRAALETRFSYLVRGKRGSIMNVNNSTDYDELFSRPTVINLSRIAGAKDKALIMSVLMLSLYEYRISAYTHDEDYRKNAQQNKLMHLTLIEEAHNLLMKPSIDNSGSGNPQQAAADLFSNMLSEIRSYGQGIVIVDQVPTRLIPDAIKNTNYKIVHRLTSPDDCAVMAAGLALREDQQKVIPSLGVGDAIICGDLDDAAAWVRIKR